MMLYKFKTYPIKYRFLIPLLVALSIFSFVIFILFNSFSFYVLNTPLERSLTEIALIKVNIIFLIILLTFIVLFVLIIIKICNSISKSVLQISNDAKKLGNSSYKIEKFHSFSFDEIQDLNNNVHKLAKKLLDYHTSQKTLLANASHELRTPLMSIQGYAEGIKYDIFNDISQPLDIIIEESKHLSEIITNMLTLSAFDFESINIKYNTTITDLIIEDNVIKGVITSYGEKILGDKIIITTGGKSFPNTGSDGTMYSVLEKYGHTITPIYAALIPLVIKEEFVKKLQGVSMKDVVVSAKIKKKKIEKSGDMLFTHFGISGPAVLKLSSYVNKALTEGEVEITLDFLKDKSKEEISKIMRSNTNKTVFNNLKGVLPQNFLKVVFEILGLSEIKASDLKKEDEYKVIEYMKEMKLTARETLTIKAAQVTSGGVKVKEINASTMESKLIKNLYFAGEVIDVDAETGGYNLQIAFSTGYLAGMDY